MKITFEAQPDYEPDRKALGSLAEKIRSRTKFACVRVGTVEGSGVAELAVSGFSSSEDKLSQILDDISNLCDSAGFGRVAAEETLMDHLDSISDYEAARD